MPFAEEGNRGGGRKEGVKNSDNSVPGGILNENTGALSWDNIIVLYHMVMSSEKKTSGLTETRSLINRVFFRPVLTVKDNILNTKCF